MAKPKESFLSLEFVDSSDESDRGAATKKRKQPLSTSNGTTGASVTPKSKKSSSTETKTKKVAAEKKSKKTDAPPTKPVKVESTPVPILKGAPKRPTTAGSPTPAPKSSTKKVQFTKVSKPKSATKVKRGESASSEDSSSSDEESESDSSSEEETKPLPTKPTPDAASDSEESGESSDEDSSSEEDKKPVATKNGITNAESSSSETSSEDESAEDEDVDMANAAEDDEDESEESTPELSAPASAQPVPEVVVAPYKPPEGFAPVSVSGPKSKTVGQLFNSEGSSTKTFWHITAPSSVPLSKLKDLFLDDVSSGKELLIHNNIKYGLAEGGSGGKPSLLLPQNKDYSLGGAKISRVLHLQPVIGTTDASAATNGEKPALKHQYRKEKPKIVQPEGLRIRYRPSGIGNADLGRICPSDSEEDVELVSEASKFKAPPKLNGESKKRKAEQDLEDAGRSPEKKKSKKKKVKVEAEEVEEVPEKKKSKKKEKSKKGDQPSSDLPDAPPIQEDDVVSEGGKKEKKRKKSKSATAADSSQRNGDAGASPVKVKKSKKSKEKKNA